MNTALAAFVEGKSDAADWWYCNARSQDKAVTKPAGSSTAKLRGPRVKTPNARVPSISPPTDAGDYFEPKQEEMTTSDTDAEFRLNPHTDQDDRWPSDLQGSSRPTVEGRNVSTGTRGSTGPVPSPPAAEDTSGRSLVTRIKATAGRAAGLIQKGVGADGVLLLDATVGSFGGLIDSTQGLSQTESETDGSRTTDTSLRRGQRQPNSQDDETAPGKTPLESMRHSVVLGSAFSPDVEARIKSAVTHAKISEKVLKSLLRRYPNGQIWHFNEEGDASDEDEEALTSPDAGGSATSEMDEEHNITPTHKRAGKRARARKRDGRAIQGIFPGIRSLIFLGMWDPHQERWFGASIAVSYSSMRIFSAQHELSYLAAFCDVVLAEVWRLEAQEVGRSKNDFVSSISHELRSPLGKDVQQHAFLEKPTDWICSTSFFHSPLVNVFAVPATQRHSRTRTSHESFCFYCIPSCSPY